MDRQTDLQNYDPQDGASIAASCGKMLNNNNILQLKHITASVNVFDYHSVNEVSVGYECFNTIWVLLVLLIICVCIKDQMQRFFIC